MRKISNYMTYYTLFSLCIWKNLNKHDNFICTIREVNNDGISSLEGMLKKKSLYRSQLLNYKLLK